MEEYRLERHFKLWEDNNTLIGRVAFLSVALAVALVVKVLTPFVLHSEEKSPALQRIDALEQEIDLQAQKLRSIKRTEAALANVNRLIEQQPWQKEKQRLIERYQGMRTGFDRDSYQAEADGTIRRIADKLREQVVYPLRESAGLPTRDQRRSVPTRPTGNGHGRLANEIESLGTFIDGWQSEYTGKPWYRTTSRKEMTMADLSQDLTDELATFSRVVKQELAQAERDREQVQAELSTLGGQIGEEASKLDDIEKELESILPQWMRGLVETRQVIQLLPLFLLCAGVYVFFLGVTLTSHFSQYVTGKRVSTSVTGDAAMSSTWTLIDRGRLGTAQTLVAYSIFFVFSWALLEESLDLLEAWLQIDPSQAWVSSPELWAGFRWLSRLVFTGLIVYVCSSPWRRASDDN